MVSRPWGKARTKEALTRMVEARHSAKRNKTITLPKVKCLEQPPLEEELREEKK